VPVLHILLFLRHNKNKHPGKQPTDEELNELAIEQERKIMKGKRQHALAMNTSKAARRKAGEKDVSSDEEVPEIPDELTPSKKNKQTTRYASFVLICTAFVHVRAN